MNAMIPNRGSAPVGYVSDLDPVASAAVMYLRLWYEGPETQAQVWNDFATVLGPAYARKALKSFEFLCDICTRHCRRPLMRHHVACQCLGADESCFAIFVGYASEGEREDALMIATTLVRPDMAPSLVSLAQDFGLALRCLTGRAARPAQTGETLH